MRRGFELSLLLALLACLVVFAAKTWNWPIVSDAAILHYSVLLLDRGHAPYRDLVDYQMPGSYLVDWAVIHTAGPSARAWRLFDFSLVGLAGLAAYRIARPYSRFAGLFATGLFAAFHAHDGVAQTGQRDLTMTVLLLLAVAVALRPVWGRRDFAQFGFGFLVGLAAAIKPTALLFWPAALLLSRPKEERSGETRGKRRLRPALASLAGLCLGPLGCVVWVARYHALPAFWVTLTELVPLHQRLGYAGFGSVLRQSMPPSLIELAIPTGILFFARARAPGAAGLRTTRLVLLTGVGFGCVSFLVQGRGYPYQRYPLVAFLLLLVSLELTLALAEPGYRRWIGICGLLFAISLAPIYIGRGVRERWPAEPELSLSQDLAGIGAPGSVAALEGDIQCLDTIGGCRTTLNDLGIGESTAQLNDEFLFNPMDAATPAERSVVRSLRERFLGQMTAHAPRVLVVTPWLFPRGPGDYRKVGLWPELDQLIGRCYRLEEERSFPPAPNHATGYRVYLRRDACRAGG